MPLSKSATTDHSLGFGGYGSNGNLQPKEDIDFTNHGFPAAHPHVPHRHKLTPNNPKMAPKGGYQREGGGGRLL